MNYGNRTKRIEAGGEAFPAHDQPAVLALEPGKRSLSLIARDIFSDWPAARLMAFPYAFGNLGANPTCAKAATEVFGIITLIRCYRLESFARSALFPGADVQGIQQRDDLGPLVTISRRGARGQRHTRGICEAMDKDAFAFPAIRHALTAAFARGKTSHPRPRTATESCRAPQPARASALAWRPVSYQLASAAATDGRRSWRPIGAPEGGHTSGTR
jgi:hypothetical protein